MWILVEGLDRTGKSTLIKSIIDYWTEQWKLDTYGYIHFKTPPKELKDPDDIQRFQALSYEFGASLMTKFHFGIQNRSHIGEAVYSQRYRGIDGSWVFEFEKAFEPVFAEQILVLLEAEDLGIISSREDGLGVGNHYAEDRESFRAAFDQSIIRTKVKIQVDGKTPEQVFAEFVERSGMADANKFPEADRRDISFMVNTAIERMRMAEFQAGAARAMAARGMVNPNAKTTPGGIILPG